MNIQKNSDEYILKWQQCIHQLMKVYYEDMNKGEVNKTDVKKMYQDLINTSKEEVSFAFYIRNNLQMSDDMFFFMMLGFIYEIDSQFRHFNYSNFKSSKLSFEVGFVLLQYVKDIHFSDTFQLLENEKMKLIFVGNESVDYLLENSMNIHPWVLRYLDCGSFEYYSGIDYYFSGVDQFLPIMQESYQALVNLLESKQNLLLMGDNGVGKRTLVKRYANERNKVVQLIDLNKYRSLTHKQRKSYQLLIQFFSLFYDCVNVYVNAKSTDTEWIYDLLDLEMSNVICCNTRFDAQMNILEVPNFLSYDDMKVVVSHYQLSKVLLEYHYTINDLIQLFHGTYCRNASLLNTNSFVSEVKLKVQKDAYIYEKETKKLIDVMLYEIKHRKQIQHNLKANENRKGTQVLFYGPSGCGKTMLASVLANELQMPLYKLDLAMVSDKYIGESEKHLESVFKQAEKENCILLFDEADVLFAKRTNVSNSNDRHANTITAYLLQRMENYDGIIILTSNLINNFDSAFMRRIAYVIRLGMPDKQMQKDQWQNLLESIHIKKNVNVEELLYSQQMSFAEIKNAVYSALGYALSRNNQPCLNNHDLQKAIQMESIKTGIMKLN